MFHYDFSYFFLVFEDTRSGYQNRTSKQEDREIIKIKTELLLFQNNYHSTRNFVIYFFYPQGFANFYNLINSMKKKDYEDFRERSSEM